MDSALNFSDFILESKLGSFYNEELNTKFWEEKKKDGKSLWEFDPLIGKKLLKIGKDFYSKFEGVLDKIPISDIVLTGSLANYNYTDNSDIDVHVLVDFSKSNVDKKTLKSAVDGIRFIWNLRHDVKIRGHEVELYVQDVNEPHTSSGLYSLLNKKWVKFPKFNPPKAKDSDVILKVEGLISEINNLESKLVSVSSPSKNAKNLHKRANSLLQKIYKMRKEDLSSNGETSVGNLSFKKLRSEGYITKLIDVISKSYERIYSE